MRLLESPRRNTSNKYRVPTWYRYGTEIAKKKKKKKKKIFRPVNALRKTTSLRRRRNVMTSRRHRNDINETLCVCRVNTPEPSCSKLTMSLVNISLKLWSLNMAYTLIFLLKKKKCNSYPHFFSKNTCELDIVLTRIVNILTTNELVKLTVFWTTGPCIIEYTGRTVMTCRGDVETTLLQRCVFAG